MSSWEYPANRPPATSSPDLEFTRQRLLFRPHPSLTLGRAGPARSPVSNPGCEGRIPSVKAQEDELFREVYERTALRVYAYLVRHADPDLAEHVLAEVYVKAWRHLGALNAEPMGWLIVTAKRTLVDHQRANQRRDRLADDLFTSSRTARFESLENQVVERHVLLDALRQLSHDDREALLLVGWDGLDHAAAAKVTGCSTPAFSKRLERARTRLTQLIDPSTATPALHPVPRKV